MNFRVGDRVLDKLAGRGGVITRFTRGEPRVPVFRWGDFEWDTHPSRLVLWTGPMPKPGCVIHGDMENCKCERRERRMTYTLTKLSGKAIRMIARYLAVLDMGGNLEDVPESFFTKVMERNPKVTRVECERKFSLLTDQYEERLRDEEGFLGDHYNVVEFVKKKLDAGFYREGEVQADHRAAGAPDRKGKDKERRSASTPPKASKAVAPEAKGEVGDLLRELAKCKDSGAARNIRRKLRRLGHRGGLRS